MSTSRSSLSSHSALYTHIRPLATSFSFGGSRRQDGGANFQEEEGEILGPGCRELWRFAGQELLWVLLRDLQLFAKAGAAVGLCRFPVGCGWRWIERRPVAAESSMAGIGGTDFCRFRAESRDEH